MDLTDLRQNLVQRSGKLRMDLGGIVAFYEPGVIAIAVEEFGELLLVAFLFHREAALLVGKALLVLFDQQSMLAHFQVEPPGGKEGT